jgi:hypothetical protein
MRYNCNQLRAKPLHSLHNWRLHTVACDQAVITLAASSRTAHHLQSDKLQYIRCAHCDPDLHTCGIFAYPPLQPPLTAQQQLVPEFAPHTSLLAAQTCPKSTMLFCNNLPATHWHANKVPCLTLAVALV